MKRVFGFIIFLMGLTLAGWVGYNLLIERLPATKGRSPLPAILVAAAFLFVGFRWMKGRQAG